MALRQLLVELLSWFLIKEQSVKSRRRWRQFLFSCLEITVVSVEVLCGGCMFWRRPEGAGWYDWVLLRSQLEEGADSEEELWVTDESDTDTEESDIGDGQDD